MRYLVSLLLVVVLALSGVGLCFAEDYKKVCEPTGAFKCFSVPEKAPEFFNWQAVPVGREEINGVMVATIEASNIDGTAMVLTVIMKDDSGLHVVAFAAFYISKDLDLSKPLDSQVKTDYYEDPAWKDGKASGVLHKVSKMTDFKLIRQKLQKKTEI